MAAVLVVGGASTAFAQSAPGPWAGGYISGSFEGIILRDSTDNTLRFDKTLTGSFGDTVTTVAGANAFSPGFCTGRPVSNTPTAGCSQDTRGTGYGVRLGYDWQMGQFVVGAAGEFGRPGIDDAVTGFSTTPASYTFIRAVDWTGSLGLRAGLGTDRILVYGTAGAVYAGLDHSFATSNTANTFVETSDDMAWGYQAGGGIEWLLSPRLTLGGQYTFTSIDDRDRFTVRAQGPVGATNPFILTNPAGTDIQRADKLQWHGIRGTLTLRF
jgi:outer membrane immunogenic protein